MVSALTPKRPLPAPDALTRPFWDAAGERRLVVQRCGSCGYYNQPPQPLCDRCSSTLLEFSQVSGRGRIYAHTTNFQRNVAGFQEAVPYTNLIIELEEQERLLLISDVPGPRPDWVVIGAPVHVIFELLPNGMLLPQFAAGER